MDSTIQYIVENEIGNIREGIMLSNYTTYHTGGKCHLFVEPHNCETLCMLLKYLSDNDKRFFIIGNGSNILLPDNETSTVVIKLSNLNKYKINDDHIYVEAGILLPKIAIELAKKGVSCLEFASGIPGTLGGCIYMNAGAYGSDMSSVVTEVTAYNLAQNKLEVFSNDGNMFSYRKSLFQSSEYVIISAKINYETKSSDDIISIIEDRRRRRVDTQPLGEATAGSVFKNPENIPAWKVIDDCGLRGYTIGGAKVSEKHCNMIVNYNEATTQNIMDLIAHIQNVVFEKMGVHLELEQLVIEW